MVGLSVTSSPPRFVPVSSGRKDRLPIVFAYGGAVFVSLLLWWALIGLVVRAWEAVV